MSQQVFAEGTVAKFDVTQEDELGVDEPCRSGVGHSTWLATTDLP